MVTGHLDEEGFAMNIVTRKAASVAALTVLGVAAGGIAWAESGSAPAPRAVVAGAPAAAMDTSDAEAIGAGAGLGHLGRHVLHGEIVLQTRHGIVTAVIARGTVTAVDAASISVKSADGVTTTFTVTGTTKARSAGRTIAVSAVHAGDKVGVLGVKTGHGAAAARMIRELPADRRATSTG
jgi:hypothetical protein